MKKRLYAGPSLVWLAAALFTCVLSLYLASGATAQSAPRTEGHTADKDLVDATKEIDVAPVAEDAEIAQRLQQIFDATSWFQSSSVEVQEGIVFLTGTADSESHQEWAGQVASKTQDVVAVVNNMSVQDTPLWDMAPAWDALDQMATDIISSLPFIGFGLVLLIITFWSAKFAIRGTRAGLQRRVQSQLLRDVLSRVMAVPVFLVGLYLVLKVAGLTRLAVTVLGGTGLLGLVVGFAFRDIAENFLASILISIQRPFAIGDLICVSGSTGFVQSVKIRSTLLMTFEGNHLQIPNATIYKEIITNFTANPLLRMDFTIGIGYSDRCSAAQAEALSVLQRHKAVLDDPEPMVLVESLNLQR